MWNILRLKHKLTVTYLIVIMLLVVPYLWIYQSYKHALENEIGKYSNQILYQIGTSLEKSIDDLTRMVYVIGANQGITQTLEQNQTSFDQKFPTIRRILYDLVSYQSNIVGITIFTTSGESYSAGLNSTVIGYDFHQEDWFQSISTEDTNVYIWLPHMQSHVIANRADEVVSAVGKIRDSGTGDVLGYILIDQSISEFEAIFNQDKMIQSSSIFVLANTGEVVYEPPGSVLPTEEIQKWSQLGKGKGIMRGVDAEQILLQSYTSPENGLRLVFAVPVEEFNGSLKQIRIIMWLVTAISVGIALASALLFAHRFTSPIRRLSHRMEQIERGDFEVHIASPSRDELGILERNFNRMASEIRYLIESVYKSDLLRKEAKIQALQAQINPHFLYNTLAAIDGMATVSGQQEIVRITQALVQLLRYSISGSDEILLKDELKHIEMYLMIHQIRLGDGIRYIIDANPQTIRVPIPKMLIQPLVENAILHGMKGKSGTLDIRLHIYCHDKSVRIAVIDNGCGIDTNRADEIRKHLQQRESVKNSDRLSIGLASVNERLIGRYGEDYCLHFSSNAGEGAEFWFDIPASDLEGEENS